MVSDAPLPYLAQFRDRLMARRAARFGESAGGAGAAATSHASDATADLPSLETRDPRAFLCHPAQKPDGSIWRCFIGAMGPGATAGLLNDTDWLELGFVCDGRFPLFPSAALERALLPEGTPNLPVRG